ncbi:MAG: hypothetical protein N2235_05645 [Fischerella sp.]|nr:hypothetical protein [Fischerella sp.]
MGVNWFRVRIKSDVDRSLLEKLIEKQAIAFQSMWGWGSTENRIHNVNTFCLYLQAWDR